MSLFGNAAGYGIHSRFRPNRRGAAIATSAVLTTGSTLTGLAARIIRNTHRKPARRVNPTVRPVYLVAAL